MGNQKGVAPVKNYNLNLYIEDLEKQELAKNTITKYTRDLKQMLEYLEEESLELKKSNLIEYKKEMEKAYKTRTVNSKIISINKYLKFLGKEDLALKEIKEQTSINNDVMTQNDYDRLLRIARARGLERDALMLQVFYFTGIRVSELKFFTVEAVNKGYMKVNNKGKIRLVPIVKALQKEAKAYIKASKIKEGAIIANSKGDCISRYTVFNRLKYIAGQARVKKARVYPHSLRHLFAKNWLEKNGNNILQLADILGHESLETTRVYTKLNIDETRQTME